MSISMAAAVTCRSFDVSDLVSLLVEFQAKIAAERVLECGGMKREQLRLGRILLGGFLAELIVFAIVFPYATSLGNEPFWRPFLSPPP
jgi:hypothetical protein